MTNPSVILTTGNSSKNNFLYQIKSALKNFLGIPLSMLLIAVFLCVALYLLDLNTPSWLQPARRYLNRFIFSTSDTTRSFLSTVTSGLFTQTSIVVTMLLLVLQQTASTMGNFIYDQFLRRHRNQVYLGYVVSTLVVALGLQVTINDEFNPVLGATVVLIIILIAMGMLIWFLYSTIQQMRPELIIETIHDQTDNAWKNERSFLSRVRSEAKSNWHPQTILRANRHGYLVQIDLDAIAKSISDAPPDTEIIFHAKLGNYIAYRDLLAEIKMPDQADAEQLAERIGQALHFSYERSLQEEPTYGIKQMETIGWTDISTAKDNPETGLITIHALRNLISRWVIEDAESSLDATKLPVVYRQDTLSEILDTWESLITVSSESMQHQPFAEIIHSLAKVYPRIPDRLQRRANQLIRRSVSAMGDHVLTQDIDNALQELIQVLKEAAQYETAGMLETAHHQLAASLGNLANRSTRAKQASK